MSEAMADYSAEAERCIQITNINTRQAVMRQALSREEWGMQYHYARNHPTEFERVFPARAAVSDENRGDDNYTESELKALSLPKLYMIAESKGLTAEGSKTQVVRAIISSQIKDV